MGVCLAHYRKNKEITVARRKQRKRKKVGNKRVHHGGRHKMEA